MFHLLQHSNTTSCPRNVRNCISSDSQSKQRLFPQAALTRPRRSVFSLMVKGKAIPVTGRGVP
jgi:hypothetical protein